MVQPLPSTAGRPSWLALGIAAALTLLLGLGTGFSIATSPAGSASPGPGSSGAPELASPSAAPTSQTVSLPTYAMIAPPTQPTPLNGLLAIDGPCLYLVDQAGRPWLPIWPAGEGYRVRDGILTGSPGTRRIGDRLELVGAAYQTVSFERYLVDPIDPACEGGSYWLVTGVGFGSPPAPVASAVGPAPSLPQAEAFRRWTRINLPDPAPNAMSEGPVGVVAFHGRYVALGGVWAACCADGDPAANRAVVWTSSDGRAWELHDGMAAFAHASPVGLVTDGSHLVAFGSYAAPIQGGTGASVPAVWASSDGLTWTRAKGPVPTLVAAGPTGFVGAITVTGPIGPGSLSFAWSLDGLAWAPTSVTVAGTVSGLAAGPGWGAVALGGVPGPPLTDGSLSTEGATWSSPDGVAWSDPTRLGEPVQPIGVAALFEGFVAAVSRTTVRPDGSMVEASEIWRLDLEGRRLAMTLALGDRERLTSIMAVGEVILAADSVTDPSGNVSQTLLASTDLGLTFGRLPAGSDGSGFGSDVVAAVPTDTGLLVVGRGFVPNRPPVPVAWLVDR